nr:hypothetical protein [Tanacetum cinerariifolium]
MLVQQGEGSGTPTEPHHIPSSEAQPPSHTTHSSSSLPHVTTTIPTVTPFEITPIRQYTRRARIAQSSALLIVADEPASPLRDVSKGESCPTDSGFIADQDRVTIAKSSTLPYDSAPRVTSPAADEDSMQQTINELMAFCTSIQRQHSELLAKFQAQEVEINRLKEKVKLLEDRKGVAAKGSEADAPIKGRNLDEGEVAAERASNDTEKMVAVLTSMDAAIILASRAAEVPTGSGSIPTAEKSEHNVNFHPMVNFIEASPLRIETTEEGTKILAIVDGILRTVSESSLRRNIKLKNEDGISSLPDTELFENLTLMGYNISPNQKLGYDWSYIAQEEPTKFTLMAYTSGSDTEVLTKPRLNALTVIDEAILQGSVGHQEFKGTGIEMQEDNNQANDRYKEGKGYHAASLPYTGNFMLSRPDLSFAGLDDSVYKSAISEPITSVYETETSTSKTSKESMEKPKTIWPSVPIIEYWDSVLMMTVSLDL